jgi:FdhD protein
MTGKTSRRRLVHLDGDGRSWRSDQVVVEEPLELRIAGHPVAVTMRTPGDDFDLAVGFLLTEGIVDGAESISAIRTCEGKPHGKHNVLDVELAPGARPFDPAQARAFYTTSSCGVCGKASIDTVRTRSQFDVRDDPLSLTRAQLIGLPGRLSVAQSVFRRTGGLHAAALFDAAGELVCLREDIGRHNAFDKVIGWSATRGRLPLRGHVILASGRASFELTQKAAMAGIPFLAAVSAPSSLAVELADEVGMTLVGFLRDGAMNAYSGHHRIAD